MPCFWSPACQIVARVLLYYCCARLISPLTAFDWLCRCTFAFVNTCCRAQQNEADRFKEGREPEPQEMQAYACQASRFSDSMGHSGPFTNNQKKYLRPHRPLRFFVGRSFQDRRISREAVDTLDMPGLRSLSGLPE